MRKKFSFIFPITDPVMDKSRREGLTYMHTGDWRVNGEAVKLTSPSPDSDDMFDFNIEEILYDGTDINPILTTVEMLDAVKAACMNHVQHIFDDMPGEEMPAQHTIGNPLGKIIYMPLVLHRKVK